MLIRINFEIVFGIGNGFASDGNTGGSATVDNIRSDGVLGIVGIGLTTIRKIRPISFCALNRIEKNKEKENKIELFL